MIKSNFWGKMIYIMVSGQLPPREIAPLVKVKVWFRVSVRTVRNDRARTKVNILKKLANMETLLNFIYGYVIIADWYNQRKKKSFRPISLIMQLRINWRHFNFLIHLFPLHPFSAPWKHYKSLRYGKGALVTNGLIIKFIKFGGCL